MTTYPPTPAAELPDHLGRPEFPVAVRGYDRSHVDEYVGYLLRCLAETEAHLADTEESLADATRDLEELRRDNEMLGERSGLPAPRSVTAFSEQLSVILQSGIGAAEELRRAAEHEARARREESVEECRRMLERASVEAERILAGAVEQHRAVERQVAQLMGKRTSALDVLGRLREELGSVLSEPEGLDPSDGHAGGEDARGEPAGDARRDDTQVIAIPPPGSGARAPDDAAWSAVPVHETATGDPAPTAVLAAVVQDPPAAGTDPGDEDTSAGNDDGPGAADARTADGADRAPGADGTRTLIARSSGNVPPRR